MLEMLALGALSLGGSLLQGMGAKQASAKQARLQMIADAQAREANERQLAQVNARREALGDELIARSDPRVAVAEAEAAGFNPVTWLQSGYGTRMSSLSDAFRLMVPEYALSQASQIPQQHSMLSALGSGLSAAGTAMGAQLRADMAYKTNMSKIDASMNQFMMGLSGTNGLGAALGASSATRSGGLSAAAAYGGSGGGSKKEDNAFWPGYEHAPSPIWEAKKPESTNPFNAGMGLNWTVPPGFANAEAYEDAGAEVWSWPYAVWKGANTILYNTYGKTIPETFRQARDDVNRWRGGFAGETKPYVPPGMPTSLAYPSWANP